LTVGPAARYISDEVNKAKPGVAYHFDDNASLSAYLQECLEENDVVLVKASNGMHLKEVINDLKENN
jgi:UDP-N-acetylmuramoyl-tripeptide--D-alanyl-D-alanine ligase